MKKILLSVFLLILCTGLSAQNESVYSEYIEAVDEYVPAPGQFVNSIVPYEEGDNAETMAEKCSKVISGSFHRRNNMTSLGGWGGYVTFHFDHPVVNVPGEYDFYIQGNAIGSPGMWSEPGIVMVSEDGDVWYELSGSADEDSIGKVIYDYEITYQRMGDLKDVKWTDNKGGSGYIYRNDSHKQEYYPQWMPETMTFKGTLLPDNAYNANASDPSLPEYWIGLQLRYGYADNKPSNDEEANSFKIDWAVDSDRQPVQLDAVRYVRVYTGINQCSGWVGETSTEIGGARDLHLDKSVEHLSVKNVTEGGVSEIRRYNAGGIRVSQPVKGVNIVVYSDGSTRKEIIK